MNSIFIDCGGRLGLYPFIGQMLPPVRALARSKRCCCKKREVSSQPRRDSSARSGQADRSEDRDSDILSPSGFRLRFNSFRH